VARTYRSGGGSGLIGNLLIDAEVDSPMAHHASEKTRLLMANEPRAYREVIAEAVRELRPGVEVKTVEPEALDASISTFEPDLVICSSASEAVRKNVLAWIELYPEFSAHSVAQVDGEVSIFEEIQLSDILAVIDRTRQILHKN
jgi:hypothetical protein